MSLRTTPPLVIRPAFWLTSLVLGWLWAGNFVGAILLMAVLLISVLVHELGHAAAYLAFGKHVVIELNGFGGATTGYSDGPHNAPLPTWQQLLVEFAGPAAGVALAGVSLVLGKAIEAPEGSALALVFTAMWTINLLLSFLNLLPVLPLDGGQVVRTLMQAAFGQRSLRWVFLISAGLAIALAVAGIAWFGSLLLAFVFGLLAVQNVIAWRSSKHLVDADLSVELRETFDDALEKMAAKNYAEAEKLLKQICDEAPGGLLDTAAHEQLAELEERRGQYQEAFDLLEPLLDHLSPEALLLYQELAMTLKKYEKVIAVGDTCFREMPSETVALRNSLSYAALGKAQPAMFWFEAAWENGLPNAPAILCRAEYNPIKTSPEYQHAFATLDRRKNGPREESF
jgi:stage IV sporulation protein FB